MELTFGSFKDTDRMVVTTNLNQKLVIVDQPETIAKVLDLLGNTRQTAITLTRVSLSPG